MSITINGTTGISGVDGTAGTPAIQGNDTNTGLFFPSADSVALSTNGTAALTVNSSQNVGIGTASPTANLEIYGASSPYQIVGNGTQKAFLGVDGAGGFSGTLSNHAFALRTNNTDRMTIATDGTITSTLGGMQVRSGTSVSASGTSVDFTSIPSWVKRITVMFSGVSLSGTSNAIVQLGTGGTPTTSGYVCITGSTSGSSVNTVSTTTGFSTLSGGASFAMSGAITISNINGNTWVASGTACNPNTTAFINYIAGNVALGGVLNMVRITTANGTDTFDAGSINILFE